MKRLMITCLTVAALASPAAAQFYESGITDGVRTLVPDEQGLNTRGIAVQRRIVDLGFFTWPVAREKASIDPALQPAVVFDCDGHDPEYRPANKLSFEGDMEVYHTAQTKGHIYDWFAYRNALSAGDCSCGSLRADWDEANAFYEQLNGGLSETSIQRNYMSRVRSMIHTDYKRMCDVRMLLDLE